MPHRRGGRVLDKFPQQIHNEIIPGIPGVTADQPNLGTFTEVEWSVPVTLSLRGSTLLEAGQIECDLVSDYAEKGYNQEATLMTTIAGQAWIRIWVMNERRTGIPTEQDNAVLAYFQFHWLMVSGSQVASAGTFTYNQHDAPLHQSRQLEDGKTGQGALVAQPTLYVYADFRNQIGQATVVETAYQCRLSLHYRNVETPSGEEFVTELMAKFT